MEAIGTILKKDHHVIGLFQVKAEIIQDQKLANSYRKKLRQQFSTLPIVLISMDDDGELLFDGKEDLISLIKNEQLAQLSWRLYHL